MIFTEAESEYLLSQTLGRLATMQPDGTLQNSPVGFAFDPAAGTIVIHGYGLARSRKFRNIVDNSRMAFVVDDVPSTNPMRVRCLELRGEAEAVPDGGDTGAVWTGRTSGCGRGSSSASASRERTGTSRRTS